MKPYCILAGLLLLSGCQVKPQNTEATKAANAENSSASAAAQTTALKKSIPKNKDYSRVVDTINEQSYPTTYAKLGQATVERTNQLLPKVACKADENPACDEVRWVALSDKQGDAKNGQAVFYADCVNGYREYINEQQLSAN